MPVRFRPTLLKIISIMGKIDNRRKVAGAKHILASQVQVFEHAGVLDAKIDEEKEWCVRSIMLGIKENADELIKFDIEPTPDGGINVYASLMVEKQ